MNRSWNRNMPTSNRRTPHQARAWRRRFLTAAVAVSVTATSLAATVTSPATAGAGDLPDLPGFVSLTSRAGVPSEWETYPGMWGGYFMKEAVAGESSMSNDGERFAIIVPGSVGQSENSPRTRVTEVAVYEPRRSNALTRLGFTLGENEAPVNFIDPQISLDGDHVVAVTRWGSEAKIVKWSFSNGSWGVGSVIDASPCGIWSPRVSEDGSTIAYMEAVSTGDGCANQLVVRGAGSSTDRIVAHDSSSAEFSASIGSYQLSGDGRWIFWNQIEGEASEVWARDLDEGPGDVELGFDLGSADGVNVWSIDASDFGRHVLIEGAADGQLWVFDRDSNNDGSFGDINEMQIADFKSSSDSRPVMSGSGNFVVWTRFSSGTCVANERAQPLDAESTIVVWSQTAKQPNNSYGPGIVDQGVERYAEDGGGTTCSRDVLIDWSGERIHWFDTAAHLTLGGTSDNNGLVNLYEFRNSYGYFLWGRRLFGGHRNVEDVADPVSTTLGNFYHTVSDLNAGGYGMSLERTYNAMDDRNSDFGYGWSHTFGQELRDIDEYGIALIMGDGRWVIFPLDPDGSGHVRPQDLAGSLDVSSPSSPKVRFDSGEVWTFDTDGRLVAMADGQGETVTISRNAEALQSAVSSTGSRIDFIDSNNDKRVDTAAVKPAGAGSATQQVDYTYQSATVGTVTHPTLASASAPYSNAGEPRSKEQYSLDPSSGQITQINLVGINYPAPTSVRKVSQTYRGDGRVDTQTTQDGSVMAFAYDDRALTTTVTDGASGDVNTYHYDADTGYTTTVTDATETSGVAPNEYDVRGLLTQSSDRAGARSAFHYDTAGRIVQEVRSDPDTGFIPLAAGGSGCVRNPDGSFPAPNSGACAGKHHAITSYTYAGASTRVATVTDPDGVVTSYEYDTAGHASASTPVRTTVGSGANALVSYVGLNADNEVVANQDGDGVTTCRYLDGNGRVSSELKILVATEVPVTASMTPAQVSSTLVATCAAHVSDTSNKVGRTSYTYTPAGQVATKVTPELQGAGKSWSYTYWGSGQLKTETDPLGATTSYSYGLTGEQTVTDPLGAVTTSTREWGVTGSRCGTKPDNTPRTLCSVATSTGPMHNKTMAVDATTTITVDQVSEDVYDAAGDLVEHRDPAGKPGDPKPTTTYEYGPMARLLKQTNPDGTVQQYRYDVEGRRTKTIHGTDPNDAGATEETTYDLWGRVTQTVGLENDPSALTPRPTTTYTYSPGGKTLTTTVVSPTANQSIVTGNEYTLGNGLLSRSYVVRNEFPHRVGTKAWTEKVYSPGGRVICERIRADESRAPGATDADPGMVIHRPSAYDDAGRLAWTAVTHLGWNQVTSCTDRMALVAHPANGRSYWSPNTNYWAVTGHSYRRDDTPAADQAATQWALHHPVDPWGTPDNDVHYATVYGYDHAGRRTTVSTPQPQFPNQAPLTTRTCYNARGEAYATIDPNGGVVFKTFHAQSGLERSVTNPTGNYKPFPNCDNVDDLLVNPDGSLNLTNAKKATVTFAYDGRGNKLSTSTWNNALTAQTTERWTYDNANQLTAYTRPVDTGKTLTDTYTTVLTNGRVTARTATTGAANDSDPADATLSSLRTTTTALFKSGKTNTVTSQRFATNGTTVRDTYVSGYTYDFAGRTAKVTENPGTPGAKVTSYAYSTAGDVTAVRYSDPTPNDASDDKILAVQYNLIGDKFLVTFPGGGTVGYYNNDNGELANVTHLNQLSVPAAVITYNANGQVTKTALNSNPAGQRTYNINPQSLKSNGYAQTINGTTASWTMGYNNSGRLAGETCTSASNLCSPTGAPGQRTTNYTYDKAGQLLAATVTGTTTGETSAWNYTYGNNGERLTQTVTINGNATPAATAYQYNDAFQLTTSTGADTATYTYDAAGRRITTDRNTGTDQTITYDPRGKPAVLATTPHGGTTTTETRNYDAAGTFHQYTTTQPGHPSHAGTYYWDLTGSDPVPQIYAANVDGAYQQYSYGQERIINGDYNNGAQFFAYDARGSVLASGGNSATTGYSPFGESNFAPPEHTFNYRGELISGGLLHLRNRELDPAAGQFTSRDPLDGVNGTTTVANPYHYADGDPVNRADPTGLRPRDSLPCESVTLVQMATRDPESCAIGGNSAAAIAWKHISTSFLRFEQTHYFMVTRMCGPGVVDPFKLKGWQRYKCLAAHSQVTMNFIAQSPDGKPFDAKVPVEKYLSEGYGPYGKYGPRGDPLRLADIGDTDYLYNFDVLGNAMWAILVHRYVSAAPDSAVQLAHSLVGQVDQGDITAVQVGLDITGFPGRLNLLATNPGNITFGMVLGSLRGARGRFVAGQPNSPNTPESLLNPANKVVRRSLVR